MKAPEWTQMKSTRPGLSALEGVPAQGAFSRAGIRVDSCPVRGSTALPMFAQARARAEDGITFGLGHVADVLHRLRALVLVSPEQVVFRCVWIRAHDAEIFRTAEVLVRGAGGKDRDVARSQFDLNAFRSAELHPRMSAEHAQHLVRVAVIMMERVDAVPPQSGPAVLAKFLFHAPGRIIGGQRDGTGIDQQGPFGMTGKRAVILQLNGRGSVMAHVTKFEYVNQSATRDEVAPVPVAMALNAPEGFAMNLGLLLLFILVGALIAALPAWSYSRRWGYLPAGILGTVLMALLLLLILGRL